MNLEEQGRSEHFKLIRESPAYRNFLMIEELQAEMMPSWSSPDAINITSQRITLQQRIDEVEKTIDEISTPWSAKQWDTVQQMQAMILHLQKTIGELQERLKPKKKKQIGTTPL